MRYCIPFGFIVHICRPCAPAWVTRLCPQGAVWPPDEAQRWGTRGKGVEVPTKARAEAGMEGQGELVEAAGRAKRQDVAPGDSVCT